ncbi:AMDHD1 [Bugula neritina]|uniref:AMDHD1 n=1 Tax=Bugula neritina TaxID=10212 RepID=A0A7J7K361_BUGNE|nr:AMDHD1 [Bugula neritina]
MTSKFEYKLLIHSAAQIIQVADSGQNVAIGKNMRLLPTIQGNADDGCCLVIDYKGKFAAIGLNSEIKSAYGDRCEEWYDATGQSVVPGLVDGHTHTVWAGDRVHEFAMKSKFFCL